MIASLYSLSRQDIATLRITDDYSIHRIVYDLFPGCHADSNGRDFLYADKGGDFSGRKVLLLSRQHPSEPAAGKIESKVVPDSFLAHEHYGFEIILNPSRRDFRTGKTVAVTGSVAIKEWFLEKHSGWGISVNSDFLEVKGNGIQRFEHKQGSVVIHNRAVFSGILAVTDRQKFIACFENGIGRCRGFGFGLLQLRPLS